MEFPRELKYSKEHEWARVEGNIVTIGITDYAQDSLGDVVYLELPSEGTLVTKDEPFGVVESVKAVSDLFSPVTGKVIEVNDALVDNPEVINEDPYGDAWMVKVEVDNLTEVKDLLTANEYREYVE
ncbi:MAG: glycine cleavage system protein GcvH, partial [Deltaproteobacteria bacterium]|nr:glycine cleavage system protein GcvH [Deltaproteobacteria bacterium]